MKNDLGSASIGRLFRIYVIPSIIVVIATNTASLVDSLFIGQYVGGEGIAAITVVWPIIGVIMSVAPMIGVGGSTLAGIHKGRNENKTANNYFNLTFFLVLIFGLVFSVLIVLFSEPIMNLFSVEGLVKQYATEYLTYVGLFSITFLIPMSFVPFLKLDGKPMLVVKITIVGVIINIFLDYLFIVKFGMGIKGAAIATGISQLVPSIIFIYILAKSKYWTLKLPVFIKADIIAMIYNGSSEMFGIVAFSISSMIYNSLILYHIGDIGLSAYGIALQVVYLGEMLFIGIAQGMQTPISFNYGASKSRRVKKLLYSSLFVSFIIGIMISVTLWFFGQDISLLFVSDANTISLTVFIFKFYSIAFLFVGLNTIISSYYTAINKPFISMVLALSTVVSMLISMLILPFVFTEYGIWMPIIAAEVISIFFGVYNLIKSGREQISLE